MIRKVALEVRLVYADIFDTDHAVPFDLSYSVHHEKRVPMRNDLHDLRNI